MQKSLPHLKLLPTYFGVPWPKTLDLKDFLTCCDMFHQASGSTAQHVIASSCFQGLAKAFEGGFGEQAGMRNDENRGGDFRVNDVYIYM